MAAVRRVVLDTNVLVAAAYNPRSASRHVVEACLGCRLMAVLSPPDDEPRPQRRQVVEGRGGVAGACTPLDPVAQADVVVAPDADHVGLP